MNEPKQAEGPASPSRESAKTANGGLSVPRESKPNMAAQRMAAKLSSTMLWAFLGAIVSATVVALSGRMEALEPFLNFADKALIAFLGVKVGQRLSTAELNRSGENGP